MPRKMRRRRARFDEFPDARGAAQASFNSLASGTLLAIGTGIFVQGVAAYDFADLFCEARCSHRGADRRLR